MTKYFAQDTPQAGLERMMMSVPGFQKRGSGMMILSRFCYKPEDVACRYCLHYRRRSCQVPICPYIAERLQSGAIGYRDLILECFGHIPHAGLHKRIQAVEHWDGPDQEVLRTVFIQLKSRFADMAWDDIPSSYLAALYLLASKERLWQPTLIWMVSTITRVTGNTAFSRRMDASALMVMWPIVECCLWRN